MNVVFADAFYWVALTNLQDSAHEQAKSLTVSLRPRTIFTTEEILTEYLNYFAGWGSHFRQKADNKRPKYSVEPNRSYHASDE
jgi:uncharacterized protein